MFGTDPYFSLLSTEAMEKDAFECTDWIFESPLIDEGPYRILIHQIVQNQYP